MELLKTEGKRTAHKHCTVVDKVSAMVNGLTVLKPLYMYTEMEHLRTGVPHFIVLCFTALCRYCVFYRLKVCGNPALSKSIGAIFPTAFAHSVSLCHILVILTIFQTFSLL